MKKIRVSASKCYDVYVGAGFLHEVGSIAAPLFKSRRTAIITDDIVNKLYAQTVIQSFEKQGFSCSLFVFPNGEQSKNISTLSDILEFLAESGLKRNDTVIALGGGVTGDITGLSSSLYMRGIDFIQIPTTLLAMVDASIGGKTAIDLKHGKNLAGTFWQPSAVFCDCDIIRGLPSDIFAEGMAEVIKCDVIRKSGIIEYVTDGKVNENIETIIESCITLKRDIVDEDEFETKGIRQLLNVGHTIGHSLEKLSKFSISHGEAVATGMVWESAIAYKLGMCSVDTVNKIIGAVSEYKLFNHVSFDSESIANASKSDKKNTDERVSFVLPFEIGRCQEVKLDKKELVDILESVGGIVR